MKIKVISQEQSRNKIVKFLKNNKLLLTLVIYNLILVIAFFTYAGLFAPRIHKVATNYAKQKIKNISVYFKSVKNSNPDVFKIDINHINYQKIAYQREKSLKRYILSIDKEEELPATITFNNKKYKVKLRLKGKLGDHWDDEKIWSLNIKVKGENAILGMKKLALQHPKTRLYLNEWVFQKLARHLGIISPRYRFVNVYINGENHGIYALEEGMDKILLENNERKEGVIIGHGVDYIFNKYDNGRLIFNTPKEIQSMYYSSNIEVVGEKKVLLDTFQKKQFLKAQKLYEAFRKGEKKTSEVFDIEKLAKLFAITDLLGQGHCVHVHNLKFYFNPITARLEPISNDQTMILPNLDELLGFENYISPINRNGLMGERKKISSSKLGWPYQAFSDKAFYEAYIQALREVTKDDFLNNFFDTIETELKENLLILQRSFPSYNYEGHSIIEWNRNYIKKCLDPNEKIYAYNEFTNHEKGEISIKVKNIGWLPIEISHLKINDSLSIKNDDLSFIEASERNSPSEELIVKFKVPKSIIKNDKLIDKLNLYYHYLGDTSVSNISVFKWPDISNTISIDDLLHESPNFSAYSFIKKDEISKTIYLENGDFTIEQNLIFPKGYTIIAAPGLRINLKNKASILSYSPIRFNGTSEQPIVLHSTDSTGQGLVIMNALDSSRLEYVIFDNLSNPNQNNWSISGAITFYYSPVNINKCIFSNNRVGDDCLNLVHSKYSIMNSLFENTYSDALDTDFSDGIINDTEFLKIGNDGIDVSGSNLAINNVQIKNARDKGISAGENSYLQIKDVLVQDSEIAITSKDKSRIYIRDSKIHNSKIGYTVFQKKPEFGAAEIIAKNVQITNATFEYLLEENSVLTINRKKIDHNRKNVGDLLYGIEFGKSSR